MRNILPLLMSLLACVAVSGQTFVSGIFQQTDARLEYVEGVSWEKFLQSNRGLNGKGYRLIDIETSGIGKDRIFWGIYTQSSEGDTIVRALGWEQFVALKRDLDKRGYVLNDVTGYALNESDFNYIGVWRKGKTPHKIWKLDGQKSLLQRTDEMARDQYYLTGVKVINTPAGVTQYLALYHHNPLPERNHVFVSTDPKAFNTDWLQRMKSNMRLIDYDRYDEGGQTFYLGVYQSGEYNHLLLRDMEKLTFEDNWDRLEQQEDLHLVNWSVY